MSEWISVKDRLPSDGELVIASGNRRKEFGGGKWVEPVVWADNDFHAPMFDSDEEDIVANFDCWMHDTTHWQPMPPPPAEGGMTWIKILQRSLLGWLSSRNLT